MSSKTDVHFSTGTDEWATPRALFSELHEEFGFTVDAAADADNRKCPVWFGRGSQHTDALALAEWGRPFAPETIWINPPYSRGLQGKFIAKAAEQAAHGNTIVMLLPARTDTKAFHEFIWDRERHCPQPRVEVRFLKGRVKFVGATAGAPFPSMVVVFWPADFRRKKAA